MNTDYQSYDASNMFTNIYHFAEQLEDAMHRGATVKLFNNYDQIKKIVFAGMGGSAIAGDIVCLLCAPSTTIPTFVTRTYTLPTWVDEHTLVICLSYSGNTEETIAIFQDAQAKKARIIGITSGGYLARELKAHSYDTILIPDGLPPRASLGYLAIPLLYVMHHLGLLPVSFIAQLEGAIKLLKTMRTSWSESAAGSLPFEIASQIYQSYPLIYGEADTTSIIARRWRGQLAENGKMLAGSNELPELNHNEIVGFHKNPEILRNMGVVWLIDEEVHPRIAKRLEITREIINPLVKYQITVQAEGNNFIERMLYLIHLGDWVSFWCAIGHKQDPTPVDRITKLKQLLTR